MEHLETKSCACQSSAIPNSRPASTGTQVLLEPFSLTDLRDRLAPNTVFVSEMAAISGWSRAEGLFGTCEGGERSWEGAHKERGDLRELLKPEVVKNCNELQAITAVLSLQYKYLSVLLKGSQ